jgi:hypothetical protein
MVEACLNVGSEEGRLVGDCDVSSASPVPWAEAVATGRSAKFVAPEMAGANARHSVLPAPWFILFVAPLDWCSQTSVILTTLGGL